MKITEVEAWLFHFPLEVPFQPAWVPGYTSTMNSAVIYRLRTDEGLEGITGGVTFGDEARGPVNLLRAYLLGLDAADIEEVHSRLVTLNRALGSRVWYIESAFWDLIGKVEGKSVAQVLGAERDRIRAYASTGQLRDPDEAAEHAAGLIERGFRGVKIRPRHHELDRDIAMARRVREAIGNDVALMCDANQGWRVDAFAKGPVWDLDRAAAFAKALEELNVEWIEEPLDMYDLKGYAELRRRTSVPIAAGELHGDPGLVRLLMDAEGVDVVQPDLVFTGGVTGAISLAREAAARGLSFTPHTWTNGLGLAQNLQVALAAPVCEWLEYPFDPPGWVPEGRDAMLTEPIGVDEEGFVRAPEGPGLGVSLDEEKLAAYGTPL